jgi:phosphotransferase system enzyme I (PtsI)
LAFSAHARIIVQREHPRLDNDGIVSDLVRWETDGGARTGSARGERGLVRAMRRLSGIGASEGIVIGPAHVLVARVVPADRRIVHDEIAAEVRRLEKAVHDTDHQLVAVSERLKAEGRHEGHLIVEAHRLILKSNTIASAARALVGDEALAAESAVQRIVDTIATTFQDMDDQYLRERGADIEAVGQRLLRTLVGPPPVQLVDGEVTGAIGIGSVLPVVETFDLHRAGLIGLATELGGTTSHTAIMMRALGLPYVLGIDDLCSSVATGATVVVDGGQGVVIIDPDDATLTSLRERQRAQTERAARLRSAVAGPAATRDAVRVEIGANIESLDEIPHALELGAESIGLLRTEFLYLERRDLPSEDEQYRDAVAALQALGGRVATFRTLDLGGEKLPLAVKVPGGANPSLGIRAIRFSARRPDIFRTQLRALYRASVRGPMRIMFPLISGIAELHAALSVCDDVRKELSAKAIPYNARVPIGVMIETPSAAITTDHLARGCDFLSLGTNDLIQYAFAADRDNRDVDYLYHPLHPAVLRLLKLAIDGAAREEKPIAICGEIAGDPLFTWVLLGLGIRQFSMSPPLIPAVKSVVSSTYLREAEELTREVLRLDSDREVEQLVTTVMGQRFPLDLG